MKRSLSVAMEIQRKNKKKGSAALESRPSTQEEADDKKDVMQADHKKALVEDDMTDEPKGDMKRPRIEAKKGPTMVKSDAFSTKLRGQEADMEESMPPKKYAEGGKVSMKAAEMDEEQDPAGLESDDDQMAPSKEEIMSQKFAKGGMASDEMDQPSDEEMMEHHASIAAAIMAKRAAKDMLESGSEDEDHAEMYAEGGQVDIGDNGEEDANMMDSRNKAALKENYDSDMEDVTQPEDSNEHGHDLSDEDAHDMVSKIRKMMKMKQR